MSMTEDELREAAHEVEYAHLCANDCGRVTEHCIHISQSDADKCKHEGLFCESCLLAGEGEQG